MLLCHEDLVPPEDLGPGDDQGLVAWRTEYDVASTLRNMGHEVVVVGVHSDLGVIRRGLEEIRPHIAFNLIEEFHGEAVYDQHVVSYLELMRMPYTGCNPRGLLLAHDKGLCRKILAYHRVPGPRFALFPMHRKVRRPERLSFPLFVKSQVEDASLGIAQASVVDDDEKLAERVRFIHEHVGTDAIAEEYVDGRELYVGVLGNQRLQTFPIWEMVFARLPEGTHRIATAKAKWDAAYQEKMGIGLRRAADVDEGASDRIQALAKRVYRILGLSGYARMDLRLDADGIPHLIEVNPNPDLAYDDLYAEAALSAGLSYEALLQRILNLGLHHRSQWGPDGGVSGC
jgi:D-alanine-D-alanine ligase